MNVLAVMVPALLVALPPTPASAIDVSPRPGSPGVVIEGEEIRGPSRPDTFPDPAQPVLEQMECLEERDAVRSCIASAIAATDPVLPADVERAVRELGLPALTIQIQPGGQTLVNVPTIFHTQPADFRRTVTLLGQSVDVDATPASYRWNHGDGTTATTTGPGRPYPATDVTHTYQRSAEALQPSVDVTYRVRYRVNGGDWQDLSSTITATGPATTLRVTEAPPVLVHP